MKYRARVSFFFPFLLLLTLLACHQRPRKDDKDEVKTPAQMDAHIGSDLKSMLEYVADNKDRLNDSVLLAYRRLEDSVYENNNYTPVWSNKEQWLPLADSLLQFIDSSKNYGLFPSDYHYTSGSASAPTPPGQTKYSTP